MRSRLHTHPCWKCHTPVECDGAWERNHDGFPEAICDVYHRTPTSYTQCECESCVANDCEGCGEAPAVVEVDDSDPSVGYRSTARLCAECAR